MKRSYFKSKPRKPLKRTKLLRRTKLRVAGHSEASETKREIQSLLRELAIKRDGGCVLRNHPETGLCGGTNKEGALILQAEHLISRSNSATFADMRNIICLCVRHHGYYKPQHSRQYWEAVEKVLGEKRWKWLKLSEEDRSPHKRDWKLELLSLKQELAKTLSTRQENTTNV